MDEWRGRCPSLGLSPVGRCRLCRGADDAASLRAAWWGSVVAVVADNVRLPRRRGEVAVPVDGSGVSTEWLRLGGWRLSEAPAEGMELGTGKADDALAVRGREVCRTTSERVQVGSAQTGQQHQQASSTNRSNSTNRPDRPDRPAAPTCQQEDGVRLVVSIRLQCEELVVPRPSRLLSDGNWVGRLLRPRTGESVRSGSRLGAQTGQSPEVTQHPL